LIYTNNIIFAIYDFLEMKQYLLLLLLFFLIETGYAQKPKRITQNGLSYDVQYTLKKRRKLDKQRLIQMGGHYIDSLFHKKMAYNNFRYFEADDSLKVIISFKEVKNIHQTQKNEKQENKEDIQNSKIKLLTSEELSRTIVSTEVPTQPNNNIMALELNLNDTTTFYRNIKNMQKVQTLTVYSDSGLIPNSIGELKNLQILVIGQHKNLKIPESIGQLKHLKTLSIGAGTAQSIPRTLGKLTDLQEFTVNENKGIIKLPTDITNLSNLEVLDLSYNGLTQIPEEIYKWKKLKILLLAGNKITKLPKAIGQIKSLEAIYIDDNELDSLPDEIGNLLNLKILSATQNKLKYIPASITKLVHLKSLFLNDNKISKLPVNMGNLSVLETLYLQNNKLIKVPPSIGDIATLKELYLSDNRLSRIPPNYTKMENLNYITIYGNVLEEFPNFPDKVNVGGKF